MRDIVDEPPIHRMWPYSSRASWPNSSLTSSSELFTGDGVEAGSDSGVGIFGAIERSVAGGAKASGFMASGAFACVEPLEEVAMCCSRAGAICEKRDSMWSSRASSS